MEDNRFGYHGRGRQGHDHNTGGQGAMMPESKGRAGMKEPTNHGGHTHEQARRSESDARINSIRGAHAGAGQREHEKILHDTHKLHQGNEFTSHGNKHGASHHLRDRERGDTPAHERSESAAERKAEGE